MAEGSQAVGSALTESRCKRFRVDGSQCTNRTRYADGWCRAGECPGYTRPSTELAPEKFGPAKGAPRHIQETGGITVGDGKVDFTLVRISSSAIRDFVKSHGGGEQEARVQLRSMLEEFLLKSARRQTSQGQTALAHSGFELILTEDAHVLLHYRTVHRERTWAQVKAGVPSRFGGKGSRGGGGVHRRGETGAPPEPGRPVSLEEMHTLIRPESIHLTWRARSSFSRIAQLGEADDDALDEAIRTELAHVLDSGGRSQRPDGLFLLAGSGLQWLVSEDVRVVIGVKKAKQPAVE